MTSASVPFILSGLPSPLPPSTYPIRESVADIVETAHRRIASTWNKNISLGALLRSYESTVLHQGAVYVSEGDYVQGYLYLYMFAEYNNFVPLSLTIDLQYHGSRNIRTEPRHSTRHQYVVFKRYFILEATF